MAHGTYLLEGITVLDLSTTFMGPYCSEFLAQLGARVIKIEQPSGDIARYISDDRRSGLGPTFMLANAGKESVVLDLTKERDRSALDRLVPHADVFMHNMRPAAAEKLGIRYEDISETNPAIVYCTVTGFGRDGPYAGKTAYDDVIQAMCGFAAVQGGGGPPEYIRTPVVDKNVGIMAFGAITSALYHRERHGVGQMLEIPMFESMASYLLMDQQGGWVYEGRSGRTGYARTASPYRKPYETLDGHIGVLIYTDDQWRTFFDLIGRTELADSPKFKTIHDRTRHIDELYRLVESSLTERSSGEWLAIFNESGIPAGPVHSIESLFDDPHLEAVGFFQEVSHPTEGRLITPRLPWTVSHSGLPEQRPAPSLGEHTEAVFHEFGI